MTLLRDVIARNRAGETIALPSVCTAQEDVIEAALQLAAQLKRPLLIEATSNQVNQFGGYTGMTPAEFTDLVAAIAARTGISPDLFALGGDHLGPQVWRSEPADDAMAKAANLMRAYVKAGFTKIHLDCSEGCAGEPAQVDGLTSAARAARLARVCEEAAPDSSDLSYVIGTEVPPPGGARAHGEGQGIESTSPEHARKTLAEHRSAFDALGIGSAWKRVVGLVVQPGLEFAPLHIDHFPMDSPNTLSAALSDAPQICFEAHSTDYQMDAVYSDLARRNFAILKIGPALTFAYRRALYALDAMLSDIEPAAARTRLPVLMERIMTEQPEHWRNHYEGDERALWEQRHFGYSDRIRYYWPQAEARAAVDALMSRLDRPCPPLPMLLQYFSPQVAAGATAIGWARALVLSEVKATLRPYFVG